MSKGILMSAPSVLALNDGRKTQTRRLAKESELNAIDHWRWGIPGDLLYVKEAWAQRLDMDHLNGTQLYDSGVRKAWYWADGPGRCFNTGCAGAAGRYRHARFMPRWASRTTLELTDVRVQRVQEISIAWNSIHGPDAWERNDWVFALTFNVHKRNVLEMED